MNGIPIKLLKNCCDNDNNGNVNDSNIIWNDFYDSESIKYTFHKL